MEKLLPLLVLVLGMACNRRAVAPLPPPLDGPFPNVCIDSIYRSIGPCEPSIAIDPTNPDRLVAGTVLDNVYHSGDGGRSWQYSKLESPYGVFGDPVILADFEGYFYYAHLSDPSGRGRTDPAWLDRIVIQRSTDGGLSWNDGSYTGLRPPKDQDKHWLAADPRNNHLFISWTEFDEYGSRSPRDRSRILFSRSTDRGKTWSAAIAISEREGNCLDDDQTTEGAVPSVGPNGEVYVAWAFDEKIWFDRSLDGGLSWLEEDRYIADQEGGWSIDIPGLGRANGMPVTATDLSDGPNRGNLYVNWADQRNGPEDTDIWFIRSEDGGETWSEPLRVNDDPPGKHQFFSWMCTDPVTGHIYILYYDRRAHEENATDVYLASSRDGGRTFRNQRISERPFTPRRGVFFGDYNHISAYNGRIRPIWTRADGYRLSVWTAIIDGE